MATHIDDFLSGYNEFIEEIQHQPNPLTGRTSIHYHLGASAKPPTIVEPPPRKSGSLIAAFQTERLKRLGQIVPHRMHPSAGSSRH